MRSCTNRTGPGESSLIAAAIAASSGASRISAVSETTRLTAWPNARSKWLFRKSREAIRLLGVSASMAILPVSRS
jgi:hypothetical protein